MPVTILAIPEERISTLNIQTISTLQKLVPAFSTTAGTRGTTSAAAAASGGKLVCRNHALVHSLRHRVEEHEHPFHAFGAAPDPELVVGAGLLQIEEVAAHSLQVQGRAPTMNCPPAQFSATQWRLKARSVKVLKPQVQPGKGQGLD